MSLETLPEFNDNGIFPNSLHEEVHEDVSYCTMQSIRGERSAALLTLKQHVSPSLFRSRQRVSPWWPCCPHRIVDYQHSGGW
ncbi:hypothetical protein TNCV_3093311 [Trichonephila clavipes]|nr:hypothetical protein TNCV_3093311 [Trichonephila clavipes]